MEGHEKQLVKIRSRINPEGLLFPLERYDEERGARTPEVSHDQPDSSRSRSSNCIHRPASLNSKNGATRGSSNRPISNPKREVGVHGLTEDRYNTLNVEEAASAESSSSVTRNQTVNDQEGVIFKRLSKKSSYDSYNVSSEESDSREKETALIRDVMWVNE